MAGPSMAAGAELWDGYDIVAIDATTDSSPGSDGTDARLHTHGAARFGEESDRDRR